MIEALSTTPYLHVADDSPSQGGLLQCSSFGCSDDTSAVKLRGDAHVCVCGNCVLNTMWDEIHFHQRFHQLPTGVGTNIWGYGIRDTNRRLWSVNLEKAEGTMFSFSHKKAWRLLFINLHEAFSSPSCGDQHLGKRSTDRRLLLFRMRRRLEGNSTTNYSTSHKIPEVHTTIQSRPSEQIRVVIL